MLLIHPAGFLWPIKKLFLSEQLCRKTAILLLHGNGMENDKWQVPKIGLEDLSYLEKLI